MDIKQWISWLVTSSADPLQYSKMIIGLGVLCIPKILSLATLACTIGAICVQLDSDWLNSIFQLAATSVEYVLYAVGGIMTIYGLGRKIWLTQWAHPAA
jgi:hypothetical protein